MSVPDRAGAARRSLISLSISIATLFAVGAPAAATGPGGWNHLGTGRGSPPVSALNGNVSVIHADGDRDLYIGGIFTNAGGFPAADRIAKWDGAEWSALGTRPLGNGAVFAIATHAGKVFAGGNFVNAGGKAAADYLAVFDGVSWEPFCNATGAPAFRAAGLQVLALQIVGPTLWVGGTFQNANGDKRADYLIGCDLATGTMRLTVDTDGDFSGAVYDLAATTDGTLYAAGTFSNLDKVATADFIAAYDGNAWEGLGTKAIGGIVRALHAKGNTLYVSSDGLNIGGIAKADHLVKWNGSAYTAVGSDRTGANGYFPSSAFIYAFATSGSLLFAGGSWQNANGDPTGDVVAYFDGFIWHPLGSNGAGNGPWVGDSQALAVFGGQVYAGGGLTNAGADPLANFAASRSLTLPDAAIRVGNGAEIGKGVYNETGAGQTRSVSVARGASQRFSIAVWNDGLVPTTFKIKGADAGAGYTVQYIEDWSAVKADITTAVLNGTYTTPQVPVGFGFPMDVVVKVSATAGTTGTFTVTARTTGDTPKDTVKGIVKAT